MTDPLSPRVPMELEARLAAAPAAAPHGDFDAMSWLWMILLGVIVPIALIVIGLMCAPVSR